MVSFIPPMGPSLSGFPVFHVRAEVEYPTPESPAIDITIFQDGIPGATQAIPAIRLFQVTLI